MTSSETFGAGVPASDVVPTACCRGDAIEGSRPFEVVWVSSAESRIRTTAADAARSRAPRFSSWR